MFQKSVLKSIKQDESLVALRWTEYQKYLDKKEFIDDVKEEKYQEGFLRDIFENCLGYTLDTTNPTDFNLEREKKNENDSKKADGVIYVDNKVVGVIELKDLNTKNLDKVEAQAFGYLVSHSSAKYVIISNFGELRFYINKKTEYEEFSLFRLEYEDFKKLHLLLSYESIKEDLPQTLKDKSISFEENISKKLYKDFSVFRTSLFENLVKNNDLDKALLLRLTQKLCDRIIFILFAEDRGLLTPNTIREIREEFANQKFTNFSLYDIYKFYFNAINEGNEKLSIPKYNGGLFSEDKTLDSLIIDDVMLDLQAQALSNYDFMSDISVNILGHIFEQSLTDLEEINASINHTEFDSNNSKRKKEGVFYTPEYITHYIVDNTLGKLCREKREQLKITELSAPKNSKRPTQKEQKLKENLEEYRAWLLNLKILDPACGSGAFLNQALEFLIQEHIALQKDLVTMGDVTAYYEIEKSILENNLYGVDINEDAVEIAKLSLWLRTASKGRELTKLADKIKCGNSLIDDKNVVDNAFVWEEEFKEVFEHGGFDVVIGNPPYGAKLNKEDSEFIIKKFDKTMSGELETYIAFYFKLNDILKENGIFGYITPDTWLTIQKAKTLRSLIYNNYNIIDIYDRYKPFYDAKDTRCHTVIATKSTLKNYDFLIKVVDSKLNIIKDFTLNSSKLKNIDSWNLYISPIEDKLFSRMKDHKTLEDLVNIKYGLRTGNNNKFLSKIDKKNTNLKIARGSNIERYYFNWEEEYLLTQEALPLSYFEEEALKEKIIIQYVRTNSTDIKSKWLEACLIEDSGFIPLNSTSYLYTKAGTDLKYILAIISSTLLNFYYKAHYTDVNVKPLYLSKLPIPEIKETEQKAFSIKVDQIMTQTIKLQEAKQNFLNELELEKISNKLQDFEDLDFEEFVKEYKKAKKLKFTDKLEERNFKNEWKSLFENDSKIALELKKEIAKTDKEIDNMVYKLYGLSDDEIKIVEGE